MTKNPGTSDKAVWINDDDLDDFIPAELDQEWRELIGYDENGDISATWKKVAPGIHEPSSADPEHCKLMAKAANMWFAEHGLTGITFLDCRDATDNVDWLVKIDQTR